MREQKIKTSLSSMNHLSSKFDKYDGCKIFLNDVYRLKLSKLEDSNLRAKLNIPKSYGERLIKNNKFTYKYTP